MLAVYIIVGVVLFIVTFFLSFAYGIYRLTFYNGKRIPNDLSPLQGNPYDKYDVAPVINKASEIPFEEVHIKSYDGLRLFGRVYKRKEGAPLHIQFNGYKGNGVRDFAGGLQIVLEQEHNVILVDQRAHGYSEGKTISFGIKERKDVVSWVNYGIERFGEDVDIFIEGISMGAATVLMAGDQELPKNVIGVIADCPYSSPKEIILKVTKDMGIVPKLAYPFILMSSSIFGRFNLNEASALESVKHFKIPVLLIHGNADGFVPFDMSKKIKESNPEFVRLVEVEGAPHGLSFMQDYDLYCNSVKEFVGECLEAKNNK